MTPYEARKKFDSALAALELEVAHTKDCIDLLGKSIQGKLQRFKNPKETRCLRLALTHEITNCLALLFDNKSKDINSLYRIAIRFKDHLPMNMFTEYERGLAEYANKHLKDIARIEKNRNLSSAHLGIREQLGWTENVAKNIDKILGTESTVAVNESLLFITPAQIFDMQIVEDTNVIVCLLEALRYKFFEQEMIQSLESKTA